MSLIDGEVTHWLNQIVNKLNVEELKFRKHIISALSYIQSKPRNKLKTPQGLKLTLHMCSDMEKYNLDPITTTTQFYDALDVPDEQLDDIIDVLTSIYDGTDPNAQHYLWQMTDRVARAVPNTSTHLVFIMEILEAKLKQNNPIQ
jgi:hypothetical protein